MILHGFPYSHNSRKVLVTAHALGLDLTVNIINLLKKESFTPQFLARNPNGLTPLLEDGDFLLWESAAIIQYLCNTAGETPLYPAAPQARARVDQWLHWNSRHWDPALDGIVVERFVMPAEGKPTNEDTVARCTQEARRFAPVLEGQLAKTPFVAGDTLTIADIACSALLLYHRFCPLPLDDCPNIWAWFERVTAHPSYAATEPDWSALMPG